MHIWCKSEAQCHWPSYWIWRVCCENVKIPIIHYHRWTPLISWGAEHQWSPHPSCLPPSSHHPLLPPPLWRGTWASAGKLRSSHTVQRTAFTHGAIGGGKKLVFCRWIYEFVCVQQTSDSSKTTEHRAAGANPASQVARSRPGEAKTLLWRVTEADRGGFCVEGKREKPLIISTKGKRSPLSWNPQARIWSLTCSFIPLDLKHKSPSWALLRSRGGDVG